MDELSVPIEVFEALRNIIIFYLHRRRETVIQAVVELRPDIIKNLYLEKALDIRISELALDAFRKKQEEGQIKREGIWDNTWRYWMQGDTCELVNIRTGERFDWKAGYPIVFFTGELFFHLKWRMKHHEDNPDIQTYAAWCQENPIDLHVLLGYLADRNILIKRGQHEWALMQHTAGA
ncbi:MAG: hypothetical protein JXB47_11635 [Anaerolineae bacterium]|nr:hypothetical protein [Anaerolineae bacterium]